MKALSIIALVVSVFGILFSIGVMELSITNTMTLNGSEVSYESSAPQGLGMLLLGCSLFLLGYSIVGTIKSFRKPATGS